MTLVVKKFGGSSVATPEKLRRVAAKIVATRRQGHQVVVVVSAMGKTTDQLLELVREVSDQPSPRELDLLLASGEQVSSSLLAMAVQHLGEPAVALTGPQSGIRTSSSHGNAEVLDVETRRILDELARGRIVIVAGFQGIDSHSELTTLGRGGSDTSAVALAGALGAETCEIFTDVDGVFSADPRVVPTARRIDEIGYEQMRALARHGARVLHVESIDHARRHGVVLRVRSTFGGGRGTWIRPSEDVDWESGAEIPVAGVAGRKDLLGISATEPTDEDRVFERVLEASGCEHDVLLRRSASQREGFGLLVSSENIVDAEGFAASLEEEFPAIDVSDGLGSVAAVGHDVGIRRGLRDRIRRSLRPSPLHCFASQESVSCLVRAAQVESAARTLHETLVEPGFEASASPAGAA